MHLTPRGWITGSSECGFTPENVIPPPPDTVLTISFHEVTSSIYSRPERWREVLFISNDTATVEALKQQFGPEPGHFKNWR